MVHLLDKDILTGEDGSGVLGWALQRREQLTVMQEERDVTTTGRDETMIHQMSSLVVLVSDVVQLLKIVGCLVAVACVVLAVKK